MKKIKFENIIAFINKAMDTDCKISIYLSESINNDLYIYREISKDEVKIKTISWNEKDSKLYINLTGGMVTNDSDYVIEISNKKDILKWKTLIEDVIEYSHCKLELEFNNFFNKEDNRPKDINDLDDEND